MIGFAPTEDQKLIVDSVAQFARTTLRPKIRDFEKARSIDASVRKTAHDLGLGLIAIPEALGGSGLGMTTAVLVEEELAWGDPAAPFSFGAGAFAFAVSELGTKEQASKWLAPFADAAGADRVGAVAWGEKRSPTGRDGLVTTATKDGAGYRLKGEKSYVINADRADTFIVFAEVEPAAGWRGVGAFLVKRDAAGVSVTARSTTLGLDAVSFGGVTLSDVRVDESDRLTGGADFTAALVRFFAKSALIVAARATGLARAAFEVTREYCETRRAFGKPIGHFQAVAFTVADRAMDVDASRALVWRAAASWDAFAAGTGAESDALLHTAYAVSFALEAAMRCGDDGVQLHGGAGFIRDYPVEKWMRDAKQLQLCTMTAEQADQLAAAIELGRPIEPAFVLPNADSQNAFV
jgi:alkylation response protein AidB-like acyl-CoA dehydrogenase